MPLVAADGWTWSMEALAWAARVRRFRQLQRAVRGISQRMLTVTAAELHSPSVRRSAG
jgi:DNA-binding HxlR family transcriptional regulator